MLVRIVRELPERDLCSLRNSKNVLHHFLAAMKSDLKSNRERGSGLMWEVCGGICEVRVVSGVYRCWWDGVDEKDQSYKRADG